MTALAVERREASLWIGDTRWELWVIVVTSK
jgi:hypothetical protein